MFEIITSVGLIITIILLGSITGAILIWHFCKNMWKNSKLFRTLRMIEELDESIDKEKWQEYIS